MTCTSIFEHPVKGVHRYGFQRRTVAAETEIARSFDGSKEFGRHLYSRPVLQVPIQTGVRYQFKQAFNGSELRYRRVDEALFGQFDYFRVAVQEGEIMYLLAQQMVPVPGLDVQSRVTLTLALRGPRTHKFADLCKKYLFEVSFCDGRAQLFGYINEFDQSPSISIPLEVSGTH